MEPDHPTESDLSPIEDVSLPDGLIDALRTFEDAPAAIPEGVDRDVLNAGRARARSIVRRRVLWPTGLSTAAAAAMLGFFLWINLESADRRGDVDGDGRVDIVDAFALARELESGVRPSDPAMDFDGNGAVDIDDVRAITRRVVQIAPESSS